ESIGDNSMSDRVYITTRRCQQSPGFRNKLHHFFCRYQWLLYSLSSSLNVLLGGLWLLITPASVPPPSSPPFFAPTPTFLTAVKSRTCVMPKKFLARSTLALLRTTEHTWSSVSNP